MLQNYKKISLTNIFLILIVLFVNNTIVAQNTKGDTIVSIKTGDGGGNDYETELPPLLF